MEHMKFINLNSNLTELLAFEQLSDEELTRQANKHSRKEPREGYECPECGNYEQIYVYENGVFAYTRDCICKRKRNSLARARRAGLTDFEALHVRHIPDGTEMAADSQTGRSNICR